MLVVPRPAAMDTRVRLARPDDIDALARIRAVSWHDAYHRILPHHELARITRARSAVRLRRGLAAWRRGVRILVAERPGAGLVGYAWCGPQVDQRLRGYEGEVYELYLHPQHQRQGVGSLLLRRTMWTMIELGCNPVLIWVLADNPARHFYETCGGTIVARGPVDFGDYRTTRIAYGWSDALPVPLR